jgi:hypothetical protein
MMSEDSGWVYVKRDGLVHLALLAPYWDGFTWHITWCHQLKPGPSRLTACRAVSTCQMCAFWYDASLHSATRPT